MLWFALKTLVPLARRWVDTHQAQILAKGVALTDAQQRDALLSGVKDPSHVRLMRVEVIPMPLNGMLRRANGLSRLLSGDTIGITLGKGIYIRDDRWEDRALIVHELVHVAQYERYGSTANFLRDYIKECLTLGYPHGPLEQEALIRTREICG